MQNRINRLNVTLIVVFACFLTMPIMGIAQILKNSNELTLVREIDLKDYIGCKFSLEFDAKCIPVDSSGRMDMFILQVGKGDYDFVKSSGKNLKVIPNAEEWKHYSLNGVVSKKARRIWIYMIAEGNGDYYYDNVNFLIHDEMGSEPKNLFVEGDFEDAEKPLNLFMNKKDVLLNEDIQLALNQTDYGKSLHLKIRNNTQSLEYRYGYDYKNGKYITSGNAKIYYEVYGEGNPLLLLHGNGQSIFEFKDQIPELSKHFKVIAVDTRGQGKSVDSLSQSFSYDIFAEDMKVLLDSLNVKSVDIVGWSDGGNTGLKMAMKYPEYVGKLVTMGANLNASEDAIDGKFIKRLNKDIKKLKKLNQSEFGATVKLLEMMLVEPNITPEDLAVIQSKCLIMAGEKDIIKTEHTKKIAISIPNAELEILENETHFLPQENAKLFNETVLRFLLN